MPEPFFPRSTLYIAVTNALSGQARLVDIKNDRLPLFGVLKATAAIYPLFNRPVLLDGVPYVDGGIANPIPIRSAIRNGCTHILVLLTRPPEFFATSFSSLALLALTRGTSIAFRDAFRNMPRLYNRSRDIALRRTSERRDLDITVILPHLKSPKLTIATTAVRTLEAAIQSAMAETRLVFRNLAE
jgi:predicted patatin/cPLA2 family phospholipase